MAHHDDRPAQCGTHLRFHPRREATIGLAPISQQTETHPDSICAREQLRSVLGDAMRPAGRYQKVVLLYYTNE